MLKDILTEVRCGHEGVSDEIVVEEGVKAVKKLLLKEIEGKC